MDRKISVFGCGVQKCGTTSLYAHFCEHPELSAPRRKEIHFFDDETQNWNAPDYSLLHSFFLPHDCDRIRFEITPIYVFWPPSIERIRAYNPDAQLIFLFRDPFERAWSHWCMEYARRDETLPFAEAIRNGRKRMQGLAKLAKERRIYTYVERGLYAEQVRNVLAHFPRKQVLFLRSEDLRDDHVATLAVIADFLRISSFRDTGLKREHSRPEILFPSEPTEEDRNLIASIVHDDLQEFSKLTGLDISGWQTIEGEFASVSAGKG